MILDIWMLLETFKFLDAHYQSFSPCILQGNILLIIYWNVKYCKKKKKDKVKV